MQVRRSGSQECFVIILVQTGRVYAQIEDSETLASALIDSCITELRPLRSFRDCKPVKVRTRTFTETGFIDSREALLLSGNRLHTFVEANREVRGIFIDEFGGAALDCGGSNRYPILDIAACPDFKGLPVFTKKLKFKTTVIAEPNDLKRGAVALPDCPTAKPLINRFGEFVLGVMNVARLAEPWV